MVQEVGRGGSTFEIPLKRARTRKRKGIRSDAFGLFYAYV